MPISLTLFSIFLVKRFQLYENKQQKWRIPVCPPESLVSALHQDPSQRRATHNMRARSPSWEVHKVTGTFTQPLRKTSCQVEYHTHAHGISSSASRTWPEAACSATGPSREAGGPRGCPRGRRLGALLTAPPRHADTGSAPHLAGKPAPADGHTASCRGAAPPTPPPGPCGISEQQNCP